MGTGLGGSGRAVYRAGSCGSSTSFGGIRGGSSGVKVTSSPACGTAVSPPPLEGSPPEVSMIVFGVM